MVQIQAAVENERLFSLCKMIETGRRNKVEIDMLNALMRIADYGPTSSEFFLGPLIEKVINLWYASGDRKVDIGPKNKTGVTSGIPAEKLSLLFTRGRRRLNPRQVHTNTYAHSIL